MGFNANENQGDFLHNKKSIIFVVCSILFLTLFIFIFYAYKNKRIDTEANKDTQINKISPAQEEIQKQIQQLDEIKKGVNESQITDTNNDVSTDQSSLKTVNQQLQELDELKKKSEYTDAASQDIQNQLDQLEQLKNKSK